MTMSRLLSVIGFSTLSAFTGFGATYLALGIIAIVYVKKNDSADYVADHMLILVAGGIVGLLLGLVIALRVAKADAKSEAAIEKKYVGYRGRIKIYCGAPLFVIVLVSPLFERLMHRFGTQIGIYLALSIVLVIIGISLFLYDRIPARFIIPIGIISWLLMMAAAIWFGLLTAHS